MTTDIYGTSNSAISGPVSPARAASSAAFASRVVPSLPIR
jgi:hypothetical protein